jgi:hypothetical protein
VQATVSASAVFPTAAEYVIWSESGRRVAMLELGAGRADVVFGPGARFVVVATLNLDGSIGRAGPARPTVLLAELPPGPAGPSGADGVRERLERSALSREMMQRDRAAPGEGAAWSQTFALGCPADARPDGSALLFGGGRGYVVPQALEGGVP